MATLEIAGKKVQVDDSFLQLSPEDQSKTVDEIASQLNIAPSQTSLSDAQSELSDLTQKVGAQQPDPGSDGLSQVRTGLGGLIEGIPIAGPLIRGGIDRAAAGTLSMIYNKPYDDVLKRIQSGTTDEKAANPGIDATAQITGGIASMVPVAATATGAKLLGITGRNLASRAAASAGTNALVSGADSAARGGDANDITGNAMIGASIGGAVPVVGSMLSTAAKPLIDAVKARVNPSGFASQKIAERLASDGTSVSQAAGKMARNGLSLADSGGQNTRNLLKTTTNIPGPAQQAVKAKLTLQAMGQGDRLKTVIGKTLADPEGYLTAKDDIANAAKNLAAPLYKQAYSAPVHFSQSLESILETPAGKSALLKAEQLAANEQVPFQQLFVNVAPNGTSATVKRVPDTRGWDYIKRAMDDMIGAQTDTITGKVTNEGRILTSLKNKMLGEIDSVNPAYKAARQVWGGQQSLDEALEFGKKAMQQPPEAVERYVKGLGPAQQQSLQVGAAEWARGVIDKGNFTQNAVLKLFGNRQQVRIWRAIFNDENKFKAFRQAMFAEAKKRETYNVVGGNSSTAKQMADMVEAGGLNDMVEAGKNLVTSGPISAAFQFATSRLKMLGGFTPKVADQVAKQLMARNPQEVRQITQALLQIEKANISALEKRQQVQALIAAAGVRVATANQ